MCCFQRRWVSSAHRGPRGETSPAPPQLSGHFIEEGLCSPEALLGHVGKAHTGRDRKLALEAPGRVFVLCGASEPGPGCRRRARVSPLCGHIPVRLGEEDGRSTALLLGALGGL